MIIGLGVALGVFLSNWLIGSLPLIELLLGAEYSILGIW